MLNGFDTSNPVMQVMSIKYCQNASIDDKPRYRISLFDGDTQNDCVLLSTNKNLFVESDELKCGSVIKITNFNTNILSREPKM